MRWKPTLPVSSIAVALLMSGCGLDVTIMGGERATSGETLTYQIKLTNISACPVASDSSESFAFVPLIPQSFVDNSPELQDLCLLSANTAMSSNLAEAGTVPLSAARALLASAAAAGAAPTTCSGAGLSCVSIDVGPEIPGGGVLCSIMGNFAPGEMRTFTCQAQAVGSGTLFNLAGSALEASGVCKAGTGQGQPCDVDGDCGAGGDCGSGICEGGTNAGNGCDNIGECPMGTACSDCSDMDGLGVDCSETVVIGRAAAPLASPIGLVAVAATLCAVAGLRLRASRRSRRL